MGGVRGWVGGGGFLGPLAHAPGPKRKEEVVGWVGWVGVHEKGGGEGGGGGDGMRRCRRSRSPTAAAVASTRKHAAPSLGETLI